MYQVHSPVHGMGAVYTICQGCLESFGTWGHIKNLGVLADHAVVCIVVLNSCTWFVVTLVRDY